MSTIDIAEFAAGIFPVGESDGIIAMLLAYFDESGTDGQHGFTCISGFIGSVEEWGIIQRGWRDRLDRDGINTFHYVKANSRRGEYHGWSKPQVDAHLEHLSFLLTANGVAGINAGFVGDYSNVISTLPDQFRERYPTAYSLCFELAVTKICESMQGAWQKQPVALVFARQDQFQGRALEVWELNDRLGLWPEINSISYSTPEKLTQLQAADMIAWETRRYMWDRELPTAIRKLPLLNKLVAKHVEQGTALYEAKMTETGLRSFAAEMEANFPSLV